ncbi:MAG: type II secretion system GspH family protein [Gemmatimonadota bacterium]|nr:type II secretion system GspH family protein [Gemmatimonadota bacterium]
MPMTSDRRGSSLIELTVVIVLLAVIGTATLGVVVHQERFYREQASAIDSRATVRDAASLLQSEARALTPADGDLYAIGSNAVEFRATLAQSVVCTISPSRSRITIPPEHLASGVPLTWLGTQPEAGDTLLVLGTDSALGDTWERHVLTAAPSSTGSCPMSSDLTTTAAEASAAITLSLSPPLDTTITPGALVRVVRRARYELYRASDSRWYLGYLDCLASRATPCNIVQPVAGPFAPGGIQLAYIDRGGAVTANPSRVARIDVLAIAERRSTPTVLDSLATTIALRN